MGTRHGHGEHRRREEEATLRKKMFCDFTCISMVIY